MAGEVEDFALGEFKLEYGVAVRIACSWNLYAGADAVIRASFYGTRGGSRMRNEQGSVSDSSAELLKGRNSQAIAGPPDE